MGDRTFKESVSSIATLSPDKQKLLRNSFVSCSFDKGECIFSCGDVCSKIFFIKKGLLKISAHKGTEAKVLRFVPPGFFIADYRSLVFQKPSYYSLVCLSHMTVLETDYNKLNDLFVSCRSFETFGRRFVETLYAEFMQVINQKIFLSPEQQYRFLMENHPQIILSVAQKDIASYLGISSEALSRLKRRYFSK